MAGPIFQAPPRNRLVARGGDELFAVRGECQAGDFAIVAGQDPCPQDLLARQLINARSVEMTDEQPRRMIRRFRQESVTARKLLDFRFPRNGGRRTTIRRLDEPLIRSLDTVCREENLPTLGKRYQAS